MRDHSGPWLPGATPQVVATALRKAFPSYSVTIRRDGGQPRYQLISKDDSYPYCLISPDADEIRAELNGA
jgi:hypothetical protein